MNSWSVHPLSTIADFQNGKAHGASTTPQSGPFPIFGSNGEIGRTERFLYDIPITVIGRVGAYCGSLHWSTDKSWVTDNAIAAIAKHEINPRYLFYLLSSLDISRIATGSAQPLLTQSALKLINAHIAPSNEQHAIANMLGSLDDKIELNRKINATLEAIVQALFTSWFVDFDEVRIKEEGRHTRLPTKISALFPSLITKNGLPEYWSLAELRTISDSIRRGISPSYIDHGITVINQKCIKNGRLDPRKARRHDVSYKNVDGRTISIGDVLINSTGVGTLGRVAPVWALPGSQVVADSHVTVVRPNKNVIEPHYIGFALLRCQPEIEALGEGTTGQTELSRDRLSALQIILPPMPLQNAFARTVDPFIIRIIANDRESHTLSDLRDGLLPKLISGELRIADAERILEESA